MPNRKRIQRRRLRSAIQDMVYMASRLIRHANRWALAFWKNNPWRPAREGVYARFLADGCRGLVPRPRPG